jgi:integrase
VTSPKTASSIRQVQLSPEMIEVLKEHRRAIAAESLEAGRSMPETVFVNEVGKPLDETKVSKAHHSALKVAGLRRIRIHDLRGTFASLLVSAGVPLFHVAKALGHSSQETTMRHYAHLAPGAAKEMPNILERYVFGEPAGRDANGGPYRRRLEKWYRISI